MKAILFLLLFSMAGSAADIAGVWQLSYRTSDGQKIESNLTLKADGDKLSGTLSSKRGSAPVSDAQVKGNDVSFAVVRRGNGDDIKVSYTGKVEGDTMKLRMQQSGRSAIEITARRTPGS